ILVLRIDDDVGVVLGLRIERVLLLPGDAAIARAEDAALAFARLDDGVDRFGIARGHGEADAAHVAARQAGPDLAPRLAAVGAAMDAAIRSTVDQREDVPPTLIGGRDENFRMVRVLHDVGDAGVVVDREDFVPRFAAVGRLVEAAIAAGAPER